MRMTKPCHALHLALSARHCSCSEPDTDDPGPISLPEARAASRAHHLAIRRILWRVADLVAKVENTPALLCYWPVIHFTYRRSCVPLRLCVVADGGRRKKQQNPMGVGRTRGEHVVSACHTPRLIQPVIRQRPCNKTALISQNQHQSSRWRARLHISTSLDRQAMTAVASWKHKNKHKNKNKHIGRSEIQY